MTFTTKKSLPDVLELTVELVKEDLDRFVRETEEAIAGDFEIPGFRKGKVPLDRVRKEVGVNKILEVAFETAMQRSLGQVIAEMDADVLEATNLAIKDNTRDLLRYTVELKLFPEVVLPPLDTIKIARRKVSVEPMDLDETLETVRASRAVLTDAEGPAAPGDRVEVDCEVKENGAIIEGGVSKNHPIMIGGKNFIPGFEDQLIGMKKGDSKEFSLAAPADFANKSVAGKKLDFRVVMRDIKKVSLPELNDDFAKGLGKFENIDQLILNVKEGLLQEKQDKEKERLRLEIVDSILAKAVCSPSDQMIQAQLDDMIQKFDQDLHRHDMELNIYLAKLNKTQDDLRKDWRSDAERQVKMMLVLRAIARSRSIRLDPEEVEEALNAVVSSAVVRDGEQAPKIDLERMRNVIRSNMMNEKTLAFLEQTCAA